MIIISYAKLECLELLGWELGVLIAGGIWYTVGNYLKQEADCDGDYNVCQIKKKKRFESIIFQTLAPIMMGFFFVVIRVFKVYNKVIKQYYYGNHFFSFLQVDEFHRYK